MREADTLNDDGEPMSTEELLNQQPAYPGQDDLDTMEQAEQTPEFWDAYEKAQAERVDPAIAQRANATLEMLYNELKIPVSSRVYVETGEEADAPQG